MSANHNTLRQRRHGSRPKIGVGVGAICSVVLAAFLAAPAVSYGQVAIGVSVSIAPPPLPVYTQPICPGPGYMWNPGYWAWEPDDGYYWVPGTWVEAPFVGALWTPGYWGWNGGVYIWNVGYWGPQVGFYGGINYGFGYVGVGYLGGYWNGGVFNYNRTVNNINTTNITNVYTKTVVNNVTVNRVSYNGPGGVTARPAPAQLAAARARRAGPVAPQLQQQNAARQNPQQFVARNHGQPPVAATPRPGALSGAGVVRSARAGGRIDPAVYTAARNKASGGARSTASNPGNRAAPNATATRPAARSTVRVPSKPARTAPAPRTTQSSRRGYNTPQRQTSYAPRPSTNRAASRPINPPRKNTARAPQTGAPPPVTARRPAPTRNRIPPPAATRRSQQPSAGRPAPPLRMASPASRPQAAPRPAPQVRSAPQREARPQPEPRDRNRPPQ